MAIAAQMISHAIHPLLKICLCIRNNFRGHEQTPDKTANREEEDDEKVKDCHRWWLLNDYRRRYMLAVKTVDDRRMIRFDELKGVERDKQ